MGRHILGDMLLENNVLPRTITGYLAGPVGEPFFITSMQNPFWFQIEGSTETAIYSKSVQLATIISPASIFFH
jgi:hypothetical protein